MLSTCRACTHENRHGAFFCSQCGTKLHFDVPSPGKLVRMNGPQQDRHLALPEANNVVGRGPNVHVHLDEESVSKQHACITFADGVFQIEDLGSSNGTFVNGKRIHGQSVVRPGDLLRLGAVILKLEA